MFAQINLNIMLSLNELTQNHLFIYFYKTSNVHAFTETKISSFWQNFHHWLHRKLSTWQLSVQPVMKIFVSVILRAIIMIGPFDQIFPPKNDICKETSFTRSKSVNTMEALCCDQSEILFIRQQHRNGTQEWIVSACIDTSLNSITFS